jgi:hypothetical protein
MNSLVVVANSGRCGSSFLANLLKKQNRDDLYIAHEDIPVQIAKPRVYNRAYEKVRAQDILGDRSLRYFLDRWEAILQERSVIETGWTSYHLLPVLLSHFKDKLKVVLLCREPVGVALSRAGMGNYHPNTFYDDSHEVSPFDQYSIAPGKKELWSSMNHCEKCLYWWYVVYLEVLEFLDRAADVPRMQLRAEDLFSLDPSIAPVLEFIGCRPEVDLEADAIEKANPRSQFARETFPISNEWERLFRHDDIISFANKAFGYTVDWSGVAMQASQYGLPSGIMPWLRWKSGYWRHKAAIKRTFVRALRT